MNESRWIIKSEPFSVQYNNSKRVCVICDCSCGKTKNKKVILSAIKRGTNKSCGCLQKEKVTKHGLSDHPLFIVWSNMLARCYNPNAEQYNNYGGRGITVCYIWKNDFKMFYDWAVDKWKKGLIFDRINNETGNYEPDNCRFVTPKRSINNTRTNLRLAAFGDIKTAKEWSEDPRCKVKYRTLLARIRIYKWEPERALTEPLTQPPSPRGIRKK